MMNDRCLKYKVFFLLGVAGLVWPISLAAQEKYLKSEEIDIVKPYKPVLADALKITYNPELSQPEKTKYQFNYKLPDRLLNIAYQPQAAPAAAIGKERPEDITKAAVQLGLGNKSSALLRTWYNVANEKYQYGGRINHLSSSSAKLENQAFSHTDLNLFGKYFYERITLSGDFNFNRDVVRYYGYNHEDTSFAKQDVKQRFSEASASVSLQNTKSNKYQISHFTNLDFYSLSNIFKTAENYFMLQSALSKSYQKDSSIYKHDFETKIKIGNINTKDGNVPNRSFIQIYPIYHLNIKDWKFTLGANSTIVNGKYYFLPDIRWKAKLISDNVYSYSGWVERVNVNTLKSYFLNNPFIDDSLAYINTKVIDKYTGFKGLVARYIHFDIKFSYKSLFNMPFFINNPLDTTKFILVIDPKTTLINIHAELTYQKTERFRVITSVDYNDYTPTQEAYAWHMPGLKVSLRSEYNIANKILLSGTVFAFDDMYAKLSGNNVMKLRGIADINLAGIYNYSKNLSIFVEINNLASIKWQRWYNYPTYGFNGILGVKFIL